jgi:hypothetical protein
MHGVWKCILPHCANSSDFKEETVLEEKTNIGRELGFDNHKMMMFWNYSVHTWKRLMMIYF